MRPATWPRRTCTYLRRKCSNVVIAAAQSLTFADLGLLREDDLPSPSGALILPRPLITRLLTGSLVQDIAFTWRSPARVPLPGSLGFRGAELPAVRVSGYTAARASRDFIRAARAQGLALPSLLLEVVWSLPLHSASPDQAHDCEHLAARLRRLNAAYWQDETQNTDGLATPPAPGGEADLAGEVVAGGPPSPPSVLLFPEAEFSACHPLGNARDA